MFLYLVIADKDVHIMTLNLLKLFELQYKPFNFVLNYEFDCEYVFKHWQIFLYLSV
jgi:hypothetical protein